jgi:hypothetical protein
VSSQSTPLPLIAAHGPNGTQPASRVKRLARWGDHAPSLAEVYVLPSADVLRRPLALPPLGLGMDGSGVGRGCTALMRQVVDKGRALPLAWRVRQAPKGHFPEARPSAVVEWMGEVSPEGAQGGFLGARECAGTALQAPLPTRGGASVWRTAMRPTATGDGQTCRLATLGACLTPGRLLERTEVYWTPAAYGPIMVLGCGAKG